MVSLFANNNGATADLRSCIAGSHPQYFHSPVSGNYAVSNELHSDEGRPDCIRCIQAGRKCDGYAIPKGRFDPGVALTPNSSIPTGLRTGPSFDSGYDQRAFHFFHSVTAPSLTIDYGASLWTSIVPRLCESEPSILHAMLAVSVAFEKLTSKESGKDPVITKNDPAVLKQYNKAIFILRKHLETRDQADLVTPLITCILFALLECIRGRNKVALMHLHQARKILAGLGDGRHIPKSKLDIIHEDIAPILIRCGVSSSLYGAYSLPVSTELATHFETSPFRSIHQVSSGFYIISEEAIRWRMLYKADRQRSDLLPTDFCYKIPSKSLPRPVLPNGRTAEQEQGLLKLRLSRWYSAFSIWLATSPARSKHRRSLLRLEVHWHTASAWVATALSDQETSWDSQLDRFSAIVRLCSEYLEYMEGGQETGKRKGSDKSSTASKTVKTPSAPTKPHVNRSRHPIQHRLLSRLVLSPVCFLSQQNVDIPKSGAQQLICS